jgi:hypothetical protein
MVDEKKFWTPVLEPEPVWPPLLKSIPSIAISCFISISRLLDHFNNFAILVHYGCEKETHAAVLGEVSQSAGLGVDVQKVHNSIGGQVSDYTRELMNAASNLGKRYRTPEGLASGPVEKSIHVMGGSVLPSDVIKHLGLVGIGEDAAKKAYRDYFSIGEKRPGSWHLTDKELENNDKKNPGFAAQIREILGSQS